MPGPAGATGAPRREVLAGRHARLEPLDPARHGAAIWTAVKGHDRLWDYMGYGPFPDAEAFQRQVETWSASADPLFFAICDPAGGEAKGFATLMRIDAPNGVVEVGNILYSPALQRSAMASEVIYLFARHVFEDLRYRRFEWKCNDLNAPSRRAALRFGFSFEGVFRQHMIIKGKNRDTAWYSMLDSEWPLRREAFERWLAPENFDEAGRQKVSLAALNGIGSS